MIGLAETSSSSFYLGIRTSVAVIRVGSTAVVTLTHGLFAAITGMGCQCGRDTIGFPDIHFRAARTVVADTCVVIIARRFPAIDVGLVQVSI